MCGIFLSLRRTVESENPHVHKEIKAAIDKRGDADCSSSYIDTIDTSGQFWTLEFYASVLSLRSCAKSLQPLVDTEGNVLMFNGEIFEYEDENETIELNGMKNDTEYLYQKLSQSSDMKNILSVISSIRGPYSFIFYNKSEEKLYFGRDFIGRRSLILFQSSKEVIISSVSCEESHLNDLYQVNEINSDGIKYIDFNSFDTKCMNSSYTGMKFDTIKWSSTLSGQQIESNGYKTISPPLMCMKKYQEYDFESILDVFINILDESVRKRVTCHNFICKNCIRTEKKEKCFHPSIAILFSGGIDSTIIALLSHRHIPKNIPIDLLNISFDSNAPDRITGIDTVQELQLLCSDRIWNFVEIDIQKEELDTYSNHVKNGLIFPSEGNETVIDESIGCSLWFASRGIGCVSKESKAVSKEPKNVSKIPYQSPTRILLSGLGADEQLGGYSRHRRAFDTLGLEGLKQELAMDLDRISSRNLGRDDRVTSDHGKEIRYPFLDEKLISFLNIIPIRYKCNLKLDRGIGEKYLLRQACFKLGLSKERCRTLKRAIQFGSRIAHVTRK